MSGSKSNGNIKNTHVVKIDDPNLEAPCRFISQVQFGRRSPHFEPSFSKENV